jgi:hypothetical protein
MCGESRAIIAVQVDASLKTLGEHGLHGSRAELAEGLDKVATYAHDRQKAPLDCKALFAAFVATFAEKRG